MLLSTYNMPVTEPGTERINMCTMYRTVYCAVWEAQAVNMHLHELL